MTIHRLVSIFAVIGLATSTSAREPSVTRIDIGNDIGKTVGCEGHLYASPTIYSSPAGENSITLCDNKNTVCVNIMIEKCPAYKDINALLCTKVPLKKSLFDKLNSAALSPTDTDILEEMKKRGTSFKQNDKVSRALYDKLLAEKIARKPKLRISGTLKACATTAESYPSAQCELSTCTVEHIESTLRR